MMFKFIFLVGSVVSSGMDAEGWVAVERPKKEEVVEGKDVGTWVVFSKQLGTEKFLVSFPAEPSYKYMDAVGGEMEIISSSDECECRLQVLRKNFDSPEQFLQWSHVGQEAFAASDFQAGATRNVFTQSYWKLGFWYLETIVATETHTYHFQTKALSADSATHREFLDSFDVERIKK